MFSCQQVAKDSKNKLDKKQPKLVIGVVVDQMRFDYLTRFSDKYGDSGFKRLMGDGFECKAHHFSYMPTFTGPGHASIFTGTTPQTNGIIANNWFDKSLERLIYCVEDSMVKSVGGDFKKENRSPRNMLVTGLGDQIKLATNYKGKSIGVSIKDRAAVLPAGKMADAAYWFKGGDDGIFISSTYYMNELPEWVQAFNNKGLPEKYLSQKWETILPITSYIESNSDDNHYEQSIDKGARPTFPYDLKKIKEKEGYSLIKSTPFGNNIVVDFAKEAIENEELGQDSIVDLLTISFSSTDYIGHKYGPNSIEIEDTYIRLDQTISELLKYLDENVGQGEYLLFLTADHGAAQVPQELMDKGVEVGYYSDSAIWASVNVGLRVKYGVDSLVKNYSNYQFFFDHDVIQKNKIQIPEISNLVLDIAMKQDGVKTGMIRNDLFSQQYTDRTKQIVQKGWNNKRSGDVVLVMMPGWISNGYENRGGTSHGSPWSYDTHVPLLFYGYGVSIGSTERFTRVEDIVPTVSSIIGIQTPMGCTGENIEMVIR
jgi:predicted AlkP superfamily pyrophosphatase or phosphodiesterase